MDVTPTKADVAMSGNINAVSLESTISAVLMILTLLSWELYDSNCIIRCKLNHSLSDVRWACSKAVIRRWQTCRLRTDKDSDI